ncbi:hypothetical protein EBZ38_15945 [bacterium]|nr:hypothetical protein [bacterium]
MTPKEKAEELVNKYLLATPVGFHIDDAKKCALICCDEVLGYMGADRGYEFWTEVKQQIQEL